jgi:hypothetical protein
VVAFSFPKKVYAQNSQIDKHESQAEPRNPTLFSALRGLKMGSTSESGPGLGNRRGVFSVR